MSKIRKSNALVPGINQLGGVGIPGQHPKLTLRYRRQMKADTSELDRLADYGKKPKPKKDPTISGTADVVRTPHDVTRGLPVDCGAARQLEHDLTQWARQGSLLSFRKDLMSALRQLAPQDFHLRAELGRRAMLFWKGNQSQPVVDRRPLNSDRLIVQKSDGRILLKSAKPHKYIRKYRRGDRWVYVYADDEKGEKHRYGPEDIKAILLAMGDELYDLQRLNPAGKDDTGFNSNDMRAWPGARGDVEAMRRVLYKYRRQLGETEHELAGLVEARKKSKAPASIAPIVDKYGAVVLPLDGGVPRSKWGAYLAAKRYLKEQGLARFDGRSKMWVIPADKTGDVKSEVWEAFGEKLKEAGISVGDFPDVPKKQDKASPKALTAEEVIAAITSRRGPPKTMAATRGEDGMFRFYSPYNPTFNKVFSNKSGKLSGITEYDPKDHSRGTFELPLVEEAIEKLQAELPGWKLVVSDTIKEARREHQEREDALRQPIPEVASKLDPNYQLFNYQNEAVRFLQERDGKALIGDEMGLGKTLQSLAYVAAEGKRALVVVPKVVRRTWLQEATKFFPDAFGAPGDTKELVSSDIKKHGQPDLSKVKIATVNYESLQKFMPAIKAAGFDTIIVDESHRMKSPKAKITQTLLGMRDMFKHRILLSGTAVKNKKDELHTQAEFIEPGLFSRSELKMGTIGGVWNKLKSTIYMARQKRTVLKDLPDKITQIAEQEVPGMPEFPADIGEMSRARIKAAKAKAPITVDFVKEVLRSSDSSVLVFSESKETAEKIAKDLGDVAILHHGQMSDDKREQAKAEFQREGTQKRVFVSTRQSLAVGATLTAADKVVFNDIPWTAADLRQAEDRAHRVGQKNNVNVYWMTAQGGGWDRQAANILLHKYELNRKINEGKQLTEAERKWMNEPVKLADIKAAMAGLDVGPPEAEVVESVPAEPEPKTPPAKLVVPVKAKTDVPKGTQLSLFGDTKKSVTPTAEDLALERLRPRLRLRESSHPLEVVWMTEELPDPIHQLRGGSGYAPSPEAPPGYLPGDPLSKALLPDAGVLTEEDLILGAALIKREPGDPTPYGYQLVKGAGHKYLRRIPTGKPKPKYRYLYKTPKQRGLVADDHLVMGSKFKIEHQGTVGHFEVRGFDSKDGIVTVRHDESGKTVNIRQRDLHNMMKRQVQKKTRAQVKAEERGESPMKGKVQPTQLLVPKKESNQVPKNPKTPAKLPEVTMDSLGDKGYDQIEGFSQDVRDLHKQAGGMSKDREYAVIKQAHGWVLASRKKARKTSGPQVGDSTKVFMRGAKGIQEVQAEYVLMEAKDVVASHDPQTFGERKDYPEGVQERRYHAIKEEQQKIDRIARKLEPAITVNTNPDAINGTPVVTEDGVVLGGNGRSMGMQRAYGSYPESAKALKAYLAHHAKAFGLTPQQVQGMKQPILVRRVTAGKDTDKLRKLGRRMNEALTQGLDPRSAEVAIGKNYVTQQVVDSLTHHMDADEGLGEFLRSTKSKPFLAQIERAGIIDEYNRSEFIDQKSGLLNEDGRLRVERVLAARMIPDAGVLSQMSTSLRQNVAKAVPYLLQAESSGWDVREALKTAVQADIDMRARGMKPGEKGRKSYLGQTELKGSESGASKVKTNETAQALLSIIQDHNGSRKLPQGFKQFALEASRQQFDHGANVSMFARPKVSQSDALAAAFGGKRPQTKAPTEPPKDTQTVSMFKSEDPKVGPEGLTRYVMHAVNWELENLMRAEMAQAKPGKPLDGEKVLARLRSFVVEQAAQDKQFAQGMGVQPLDSQVLRGLIQAHAKANVTDLAKSLARSSLWDNLQKSRSTYHA